MAEKRYVKKYTHDTIKIILYVIILTTFFIFYCSSENNNIENVTDYYNMSHLHNEAIILPYENGNYIFK